MNRRVFVYGTLLRDEPNHRVMVRAGARFVREARTVSAFTLVDLGPFPALREGGTTSIHGEVYEVGPEGLDLLDRFEGLPRLYERVSVRLDDGEFVEAYLQRGRSGEHDVVASKDWRTHRREKSRACETA